MLAGFPVRTHIGVHTYSAALLMTEESKDDAADDVLIGTRKKAHKTRFAEFLASPWGFHADLMGIRHIKITSITKGATRSPRKAPPSSPLLACVLGDRRTCRRQDAKSPK